MQQRDLGGKEILSREDKQQLEVREGRVAAAKGVMSTQVRKTVKPPFL